MPPIDAAGWAAIIAFAALVLTQFPPLVPILWQRLRGPRVRISSRPNFSLNHWLGRTWVLMYLQVANEHSGAVAIEGIDCAIRAAGGTRAKPKPVTWLTAQSFIPYPGSEQLFIGTIRLQAGEHWQNIVTVIHEPEEAEEEETQTLVDDFNAQINGKLDALAQAGKTNEKPVEVEPELLSRAMALFHRRFAMTKGEYEMFIAARDKDNKVLGVTKFKFIVYEGMVKSLRAISEDYKYGWGISEDLNNRRFPVPRLKLIGSGKDVRQEYAELLRTNPRS